MTTGLMRLLSPNGHYITVLKNERRFIFITALFLLLSLLTSPYPGIARWLGFLVAGYATVANDSIQTIGTFIASNRNKPWWLLWIFIGSIFILTTVYSWLHYAGDVSYGRLASKGFSETPVSFSFLQVAAPVFLLILTRLKMPVSTTFLILTAFSTSATSIEKVLMKSLLGYGLAFGIAFITWISISHIIHWYSTGPANPLWRIAQWFSTGVLWSVWLMQDAANIAVYLPRQLSLYELVWFITPIFLGLGFMLFKGGAAIQTIVEEKSRVHDVRSATLIDIVFTVILFYFKIHSNIPMSTTWVFLGLLAGREIAMSLRNVSHKSLKQALGMCSQDVFKAVFGLIISLLIAIGCNSAMREALFG